MKGSRGGLVKVLICWSKGGRGPFWMRCCVDVSETQTWVSSSSILQAGMLRSTQRLSGKEAGHTPLCQEREMGRDLCSC